MMTLRAKRRGIIFIISAPSGCGKTTLANRLRRCNLGLSHPISYTTRLPRPGEEDGKNYRFLSQEDFRKKKEKGEFFERTKIYDEEYATPRNFIEAKLREGKDILLSVDVRGARSIKKLYPRCVTIFVLPPSMDTLKDRLMNRNQDSRGQLLKRLREAKGEIKQLRGYDYCVVNDDLDEAVKKLKSIVMAERVKVVYGRS